MPPHAHHEASPHAHDQLPPYVVERLDAEAEALPELWTQTVALIAEAAPAPPARIADLGTGTGVAARALAEAFPGAEVYAVDRSPELLGHVAARARERHLAVRAVEADLDAGWPDLAELDLVFASMSLHHVADPPRTLADALRATRPGGLLAVAEVVDGMRVLPPGTELAEFEERLVAVNEARHTAVMPTLGTRWAPRIADAGWRVEGEHDLVVDRPADDAGERFAALWLGHVPDDVLDRLGPDDAALARRLQEPVGLTAALAGRPLQLRTRRVLTLARRPDPVR